VFNARIWLLSLVLVGCGTFDPVARAQLQTTVAERMSDEIRARLKDADQFDEDARLKASAEAMTPIYSVDLLRSPHEEDQVDARAHHETWGDMLRLQAEGVYPAALAAIKVLVLMVHGQFDPHPGRVLSIEPGKRGGRPCIRGMRIAVGDVLGWLAEGMSQEQILDEYPELTERDIRACLAYAADRERRLLTV